MVKQAMAQEGLTDHGLRSDDRDGSRLEHLAPDRGRRDFSLERQFERLLARLGSLASSGSQANRRVADPAALNRNRVIAI